MLPRQPVSKELWQQLQPLIPEFVPSTKGGARKLGVSSEAALNGILTCYKLVFLGKIYLKLWATVVA